MAHEVHANHNKERMKSLCVDVYKRQGYTFHWRYFMAATRRGISSACKFHQSRHDIYYMSVIVFLNSAVQTFINSIRIGNNKRCVATSFMTVMFVQEEWCISNVCPGSTQMCIRDSLYTSDKHVRFRSLCAHVHAPYR